MRRSSLLGLVVAVAAMLPRDEELERLLDEPLLDPPDGEPDEDTLEAMRTSEPPLSTDERCDIAHRRFKR